MLAKRVRTYIGNSIMPLATRVHRIRAKDGSPIAARSEVLISPTRPRSMLAAIGSLPSLVVGFLDLVVTHEFTLPSHQQGLAGGEGLNQPGYKNKIGQGADGGWAPHTKQVAIGSTCNTRLCHDDPMSLFLFSCNATPHSSCR